MKTTTKKTFAFFAICGLLALALAAACFTSPCSARAAESEPAPVANWTDGLSYDADFCYGGGDGTAPDPYIISSPEHLAQLAANQNDLSHITGEGAMYSQSYSRMKYFRLAADLDMQGKNWIPIGNLVNGTHTVAGEDGDTVVTDKNRNVTFTGGFDFAGHKITGLSHTGYDGQYYGLFGAFAGGRINNPDVTFGNVSVRFTAGENSVFDDAIYAHAMVGGVVGFQLGSCTIGEAGGDSAVHVKFDGDFTVENDRNSFAYIGGMVGYAMGGTLGSDGKAGNTTLVAEVGENGSLKGLRSGGHMRMGGIFGDATKDVVVGARHADNDGNVTIRFINNNASTDAGFSANMPSQTSRCGGIAGHADALIGSNGGGDVIIEVINYGTMRYQNDADSSYSAGVVGSATGVVGSKGTGDVYIHMENHGLLYVCNTSGGLEIRFSGLVGYIQNWNNTLIGTVGIANPQSDGNVVLLYENAGNGKFKKEGAAWNYCSGYLVGYRGEKTLVGTRGTGTLQYIVSAKKSSLVGFDHDADEIEKFLDIPMFHASKGAPSAENSAGSLDGGDTVVRSKTFGYLLTDEVISGFSKCNDWEECCDTTDKLTAAPHTAWQITGANESGVIMALSVDDGYGFLGWENGDEIVMTPDGKPYAVFTGANVLPVPQLVELDAVEADFTAVEYNGQMRLPVVQGYTAVCLDEDGNELTTVLPNSYRVKALKLYKGDMFVGIKQYSEPQIFIINKAANETAVPCGAIMLEAGTETYTADGKYEIAADADFTELLPNSGSLTQYKGKSLFVRERATETHNASAATEVALTAYTLTLPAGEGYTIVSSDERTVYLAGAEFLFAVLTDDGWLDDVLTVKANGVALTASGGVYSVCLTEDTVITVEGIVRETYYSVTLTNADGVTLAPVTVGQTQVKEGESFAFTATKAEDFAGEFTVLVNGSAVTATDGIYTISNVRENITVTVTVKMPEPPVQDNKPSESGKKKKCGGNVAGNFALLGILTVGFACVLTVRGKKSKLG